MQRPQSASLDTTRSGASNPGLKESFSGKRELAGRTWRMTLSGAQGLAVLHILNASCSRNPSFNIFQTFSSLFPDSDFFDLGLDAPDLEISREVL